MSLALLPEDMVSPLGREILSRLTRLHPKSIDLSLGRLERLLASLGNPHRRMPPVIHIAGTNGKGSTLAYLRAALEAAGYRVHVYTSPHLVRFNERIRLAGTLIADDQLEAVLSDCEVANAGQEITFFEITSAAAFLAFAQTPGDVVLLETGLGGRFDTTNVVERPALTAITPVSMDHQQYLGDTLAAIAGEKAGILKPGVPAVIGAQEADALDVIAVRAAEVGAPLHISGRDWCAQRSGDRLRFAGDRGDEDLPLPALLGVHQVENAGIALACLDRLAGFDVPPAARAVGLTRVTWPGRLQSLGGGRLAAMLPAGSELWLDGGHNPAAGRSLADTLTRWAAQDAQARPLHLIVGMLESKEPDQFLAPMAALDPDIATVAIPGAESSFTARDIVDSARAVGLQASPVSGVEEALRTIAARSSAVPPRVLICGSLYLAGHVLSLDGRRPT
jgi:dihydrofolate synthase/folylpolyglutamate synthase